MRLILVLFLCGFTPCFADELLGIDKVKPLMSYLKEHGNKELQEENIKKEENYKGKEGECYPDRQYLVAAVVSTDELNIQPETLGKLLLKGNRLKTYINKKQPGCGNARFHGEMEFLHHGGLDTMVKSLRDEKGTDTNPVVLLYSFYIPCAHVSNVDYSCSEEVGKAAYENKYQWYIGYTEVYNGTNEAQALQYLSKGRALKLLRDSLNSYVELTYTPPADNKPTFQKHFSNCLFDMGIGSCQNNEDRHIYIARYINMVVYQCTHSTTFSGYLTRYSRTYLLKCIKKEVNSCQTCKKCKQKKVIPNSDTLKFIIEFCSESVMEPNMFLGKVKRLDDASWEIWNGPWKDLTDPLDMSLKRLPCLANNDASSACMKKLEERINELDTTDPRSQSLTRLRSAGERITGTKRNRM